MLENLKTYTVESVTSGHPDKMCDQISDAILDACLSQDRKSRVAIECLGAHGLLVVGGEVTTNALFNTPSIARKVYKQAGYNDKLKIITDIIQQSQDISQGVDTGGAGDQGIMYGYATDETPEFLPLGVVLVHKLAQGLENLRKEKEINWLRPDGKTQVTMQNGQIETALVSCQHDKKVKQKEIKQTLIKKLIKPIIGNLSGIQVLVNPTGKFVTGGFEADTGLTGRKIMVDTYGGFANGLAKKCLVSVSYAIGKVEPLMVEAVGENGKNLSNYVKKKFDFRPRAIIERLDLLRPIYRQTATYGHFGKDGLPWEMT
jgi:S-adenosylmethionine synthetase